MTIQQLQYILEVQRTGSGMLNMVSLLKVPAAFCLGLSDDVCLPEFVYSAYQHAATEEKTLAVYPFTPHALAEGFREFVHSEFSKL